MLKVGKFLLKKQHYKEFFAINPELGKRCDNPTIYLIMHPLRNRVQKKVQPVDRLHC